MRTSQHLPAAAIGAAALVALGATAGAAPTHDSHARAPKGAERTALVAAGQTTVPRADRAKFRITNIRVSSRSRYWATLTIAPRPRYRQSLQGAYAVLVRSAVSNRWQVLDLGTSQVGCAIAPHSVLDDLGIGGECGERDRL